MKRALWIATILVAMFTVCIFLRAPLLFHDFQVFYLAGQKAVAHSTVYDVGGHYQFKYSPFVALLFGFTISQLPNAFSTELFFYVFSTVLWLILLGYVAREAIEINGTSHRFGRGQRCWILVLAFFIFFNVGLRDELKLGQVNVIPLTLLAMAFRTGRERFNWKDAALISLAVQFKLYSAIVLPILLFRRQWKALASILAWTLGFNVIVPALWNPLSFVFSEDARWIQSLFSSTESLIVFYYNVSILAVVGGMTTAHGVHYLIWAGCCAGFLLTLWMFRRTPAFLQFCACLSAILLLNPIAWPYWILFSFPAVLWILDRELAVRSRTFMRSAWLVSVGALLLFFSVAQNDPQAHYWGLALSVALLLGEWTYQVSCLGSESVTTAE